jgi:HSP20 family protein
MKLIRYQRPELEPWSPFDHLTTLRDEINRLFGSAVPGFEAESLAAWTPALDVYQDKDNVVVKAELPGMKKEEIEITLLEGSLTLSGERKYEEEHKEENTFRRERFHGKFRRTVSLPVAVDSAKVKAAYKDGILTVTLPKAEEAKPRQIQVNVS